jgi:hypothetical protein
MLQREETRVADTGHSKAEAQSGPG